MKKIGHNIFLDGDKVFSYLTHVATIDGDKLIEHGKYSASTSRHVTKVAKMYGLTIIKSTKKVEDFNWLPTGIRI